jgi:hypothetical protein
VPGDGIVTAGPVLLVAFSALSQRQTPPSSTGTRGGGNGSRAFESGAESPAPDTDRTAERGTTAPAGQPALVTPPAHRSAALLLAAVALGGLIYRAGSTHRDQSRSR